MRPPCDEAVIRSVDVEVPCRAEARGWILAATILGSSMAFIDSTYIKEGGDNLVAPGPTVCSWLAYLLWVVYPSKLATLSWRLEAVDVTLNVRACGLSGFHLEEISGVRLQIFQLHSMRAPALAPGSLR